jgi:Chaperone of endosialidase
MHRPTPLNTATLPIHNPISPSPLRRGFPVVLLALALGLFALSPTARAVDPPPDEGHANQNNTTGDLNTANGADTLCNMMMLGNTPYGCHALESNTGLQNTAIGCSALKDNTMGNSNTAIGRSALVDNTMGNHNTAVGFMALSCNTGSDNIALGRLAGTYHMAGNNNIYIGNTGNMAPEEGKIRIGTFGLHTETYIAGQTHIAGIRSAAVSGSPVVIGMDGKLGVTMSSAKFKEAIKPMDKASEAILALKPVTFRYKEELDPNKTPQFGLVAEQVEKVNPDLVVRDEDGKVMTVRYEAVNAMLLNEFLKEHRKGQEQERKVAGLEATVAQQQKQIEALTATIQKVSDQVALSKPAPQVVANP